MAKEVAAGHGLEKNSNADAAAMTSQRQKPSPSLLRLVQTKESFTRECAETVARYSEKFRDKKER